MASQSNTKEYTKSPPGIPDPEKEKSGFYSIINTKIASMKSMLKTADAEFESKHPRANNGEFGEGDGTSQSGSDKNQKRIDKIKGMLKSMDEGKTVKTSRYGRLKKQMAELQGDAKPEEKPEESKPELKPETKKPEALNKEDLFKKYHVSRSDEDPDDEDVNVYMSDGMMNAWNGRNWPEYRRLYHQKVKEEPRINRLYKNRKRVSDTYNNYMDDKLANATHATRFLGKAELEELINTDTMKFKANDWYDSEHQAFTLDPDFFLDNNPDFISGQFIQLELPLDGIKDQFEVLHTDPTSYSSFKNLERGQNVLKRNLDQEEIRRRTATLKLPKGSKFIIRGDVPDDLKAKLKKKYEVDDQSSSPKRVGSINTLLINTPKQMVSH